MAAEAIEPYLATQNWQINATKNAIKKADSKKAKFIDHQKVSNWLNTWGNEEELDPLK